VWRKGLRIQSFGVNTHLDAVRFLTVWKNDDKSAE
jgi:hypothetical protein